MPLAADLIRCLTGEAPTFPTDVETPSAIIHQLADAGWDGPRLADVKDRELAAGRPWPAQPPREREYGFAQFHALQQAVLRELGLDGVTVLPAAPSRPLDAAERRLVADLPPHFGRL